MRYVGLSRFCKWAAEEGELPANPMAGMERPAKPEEPPVPVLTDAELAALVKACAGGKTEFVRRRDEAVVRMLLDCGTRISELAGLGVGDVDMSVRMIRVVGKGRRPRDVPFGTRTARALDRYLRIRKRHPYADERGLWLGQRGAFGIDGIDNLLRVLAERAGVNRTGATDPVVTVDSAVKLGMAMVSSPPARGSTSFLPMNHESMPGLVAMATT